MKLVLKHVPKPKLGPHTLNLSKRHFSAHPTQTKTPYDVYGELQPGLRQNFTTILETVSGKVTRAAARGITGALIDHETRSYDGKPYEEVFDIVFRAIETTMDNPINISNQNGAFSSWDIFRRMGMNTFLIKEFIEASVLRSKPFNLETTIKAFRYAHLYSFGDEYKEDLDGFNQRNPGLQAYDLRQILTIQQHKEQNGTHKRIDELSIINPNDILFTRWLHEFPHNATEKDIAGAMFDLESFTPGRTQDEVIRYVIGVWAGALATALRKALTFNNPNQTFMGWGEGALWGATRLAFMDVTKEGFWMDLGDKGFYTRQTIINVYTLSILYTANELLKHQDGHIHRHQKFYFQTPEESRESFTHCLREVYAKSLELQPGKGEWRDKAHIETAGNSMVR